MKRLLPVRVTVLELAVFRRSGSLDAVFPARIVLLRLRFALPFLPSLKMPPPKVAELPVRVHWLRLRLALPPLLPLLKMPPPKLLEEFPERVQALRVSWTALPLPLPSAQMAPPKLAFPPVRVRP